MDSQDTLKDLIFLSHLRLYRVVKTRKKTVIVCLLMVMLTMLKFFCMETPHFPEETINAEDILKPGSNTITVVTAYWNLGSFRKGEYFSSMFEPDMYKKWMATFQYLANPLVAFVDDERLANHLRHLRRNLANRTKVFVVDKSKLWSFGLKDKIANVFSNPEYPKFYPDTVLSEYSCAQHAKYDSVQMAIEKNYFHTDYFTWLDIGYFRYETESTRQFALVLPPKFDSNRIAVTEVNSSQNSSIKDIIYEHEVWVGGGMVLGKSEIFLKFIAEYRRATETFINMSLICTDQQVLYGLYCLEGRKLLKPKIELQTYKRTGWPNQSAKWFYLGFVCHRYVNYPVVKTDSNTTST